MKDRIKPYKCEICQQHFSNKFHRNTHVALFFEEKHDFRCHISHVMLKTKSQTTKHIKNVHKNMSFQCSFCDASFVHEITLNKAS